MPETIRIESPFYKIIPAETGKALAGVDRSLPAFQPVHIGADITAWHIQETGEEGVFRLSLRHSYEYVGVANMEVIASFKEADDKSWRINKLKGQDLYSIVLVTGYYPNEAWTLSSKKPDAKIVIGFYETTPRESQLFRIVPLDNWARV